MCFEMARSIRQHQISAELSKWKSLFKHKPEINGGTKQINHFNSKREMKMISRLFTPNSSSLRKYFLSF